MTYQRAAVESQGVRGGAMPRAVLDADAEAAADKAGGSDLKFLLSRQDVTQANQRLLFHYGVTTIEKFASFVKDRADLDTVLKEHWGLDQDASLDQRVQVAGFACAWNNAQTRTQKTAEVDAEHDVMDRAKPLVPGEWASMRAALERRQGQLEDKVMPAKEYIEKKLAEVEANEYRAESLTEVVSKEEVDPDTMMAVWDMKGKISMRRAGAKVEEPANAEQLTKRLTIMKNAFILVGLKHTNRPELQGDWNQAFESLKDYVLGDYVYGLTAKDSEGYTIATPPWSLVVSYEAAIRKHAAKLVNQEGKTWPVSLKEAIKDPTTKERYFTTPLALYAKRPAAALNASASSSAPKKGDAGQGGKKGRGRGKSGARPPGAQHCASHTPEGDMICYRFNTAGEKCRAKKCKYKHVCGACFSTKHALPQCTAKTRAEPPPDTTGTA